jgi:hypothetical protein
LNPYIISIAEELKIHFLDDTKLLREVSIFLCGGSGANESQFRRELGAEISKTVSKHKYSAYYPEDMFIELILGHQRENLLTLENLLADSVNAVVILLQSPGTFAELGAFANYEKLKDKLIVVIDPKFAHAKSFINLGPIRYLRQNSKSKVLLSPMDSTNLKSLTKQIADEARVLAKYSSMVRDLSNPIWAYRFCLALIYVFDPIPRSAIFLITRHFWNKDTRILDIATETVINSLISERKVFLNSGNISMTSKGLHYLIYHNETKKKARKISDLLTELRLNALNLTLRKEHRRVWGEAEGS